MTNRTKEWTVVVLSESQARMRQFRLTRYWFYVAVAVSICFISLFFVFGFMTWSLSAKVNDNTALQAKVTELEKTNERIRDIAERLAELKQFEQQLRRGLLLPEGNLPSDEALMPDDVADDLSGGDELAEESSILNVYSERQSDYSAESVLPADIPTLSPVRGYVTRPFESQHALTEAGHDGIDIAAREGSSIQASANGLVLFSGWSYPYGNLVVIGHKSGYYTYYGHNQLLLVEPGDRVIQGQPIALLGNSGRSSAPHLHFEIWKDGQRVNPESVLARNAG